MVFRAGSLSWSRAAGEFVVIVLGVLVALAADSWNDARLERIEETEYLLRLHHDLQRDTAQHGFVLDWMDRKERSLRHLREVLASTTLTDQDTATLLSDLANASNFGWNVGPLAVRATFEDLRSSGKLGLIRDAELRAALIAYQDHAEGADRRLEARKTEFPRIAYQLVPTARDTEGSEFGASERAEAQDVAGLLVTLRASELPMHIIAETNRALFIRNVVTDLRSAAAALLGEMAATLERS